MAIKESWRWIALVLLLVCGIDLRLYFLAQDERQATLARAHATLHTSAKVLLGRMDQLLDTYDRTLSGIGEAIGAHGGLSRRPDLYLHRLLLRRHAITPGLNWLMLAGTDGRIAELSDRFPASDVDDVSQWPFYQLPLRHWEMGLYIGPAQRSPHTDEPFVPVSRRVENDGERLLGVVAGGINPEQLRRLLEDEDLPPGFALHLLLEDGRALACLPLGPDCLERNWLADPGLARAILAAPHGPFDNGRVIGDVVGPGAFARSERYPVLVVATADEARVLEPWRDSLPSYWVIALGSNIGLAALAYFAYHQLLRRRRALEALREANQGLEARVAQRTAELRQREAQARTFMDTAMDAVVVLDQERRVLEFNRAAERLFGFRAEELLGRSVEEFMPEQTVPIHRALLAEAAAGNAADVGGQGREMLALAADGREFPVEVSIGSAELAGGRVFVGILRDISERKAVEEELQRLATTDGLTGILNRRAFTAEAERLVALARRHDHPLALFILDADKFKNINDSHGHPVGDQVLQALVGAIGGGLRQSDVFGRLGGEEFGLLLPQTPPAGAHQLGQRLLQVVRQVRLPLAQGELSFSVSIGAALLAGPGDDLEAMMHRADAALYAAKAGGRDRLAWEGWQPPAA